jgi:ankyrin repeat protein
VVGGTVMNQTCAARRRVLAAAIASLVIPLNQAHSNTDDLDKAIDTTSQLVVMITDQLGTEPAFGAGIVFGRDKDRLYIVTANHVVRRGPTVATNIRVAFKPRPDKALSAKLLAQGDRELDVAVVVLEGWAGLGVDGCKLPFNRLGNTGALQRGNTVYAIGNPNGEKWRMPAPDRLYSIGPDQLQFQSAFIAVGSSGGALLNSDARIVGMVRRDEAPSGSAIPMSAALALALKWGYPVQLRGPLADGATPLHIAAGAGDVDRIKAELAAACSDTKARDVIGLTPILWAVRTGQLEAVRVLIQSGADVKAAARGTAALHFAARLHDVPLAKLLVDAGADVNGVSAYPYEDTPLLLVDPKKQDTPEVAHAKAEFTRLLVAAGADVNTANHHGETALVQAVKAGNHEMVTALLEAHANVNPGYRVTPLELAIESGDMDTIKLLLDAGADVNGGRVLEGAMRKENGLLIALLLRLGARLPNADKATYGPDLLQQAIRNGWTDVVKLALDAGADVNSVRPEITPSGEVVGSSERLTPLEIAASLNKPEIVKLLRAYKADVNLAYKGGATRLRVVACEGAASAALIKRLASLGAEVNAADYDGNTPLHLAVRCHSEGAVRALLQAGADINARNKVRETPLTMAKGTPLEAILLSNSMR